MIYIDDNYNVWLITLIGASGKSANAPLLPKEKEIKNMYDITKIIEHYIEAEVTNYIETAITNVLNNYDFQTKINSEVESLLEDCEDTIDDMIATEVKRYFE